MTATVEARRGTRSGLLGLAGAAIQGAFGFVLTMAITRTFGADGSGALFTVIGLVTIVGAVCCLGADTGLLWAIPRQQSVAATRGLLSAALLPTLSLAVLIGLAGAASAGPISRALLDEPDGTALIRLAFTGLPVIVAATVLLAAVRATRSIGAYVGVQLVFVPMVRPLLLILAGGGLLLGFTGWLVPLAAAAVIAFALAPRPAAPSGWRSLWTFALPRAASVVIDASSMWVGVLLTGALATQAQAGVFAAVGRYALAGLLIMHGLRVALAPQLSRLLGAGQVADAAHVYRRTTWWIVVMSWPVYLLLAVFAPAFLSLFGPQFAAGATPMTVLSVAMLVNVGVGLMQTMLLMSGNSRGHLLAAVAGLALNVTAALLLIPRHGALGAAVAWSLGIVCENVFAAVLARRALAAPLFSLHTLLGAGAVVGATLGASLAGVVVAGRALPGLAVALAVLLAGGLLSLLDRRVRTRLSVASLRELL